MNIVLFIGLCILGYSILAFFISALVYRFQSDKDEDKAVA